MKAAVLHALGSAPRYEDFADPVPQPGQVVLAVQAASLTNLDKRRAAGNHYANYTNLPTVVGFDGVGRLADGRRVYAQGLSGMMAGHALIRAEGYVPVPDGLGDVLAAALPNAAVGAALSLRFRAGIQPGDVVLVNGATGVTGQLAVQLARHYGAATIIATGRNAASLARVQALGADYVVSLQQEDRAVVAQLKEIQARTPITSVLDMLWGQPLALVLNALQGGVSALAPAVRVVTVGGMAGDELPLSSMLLRSTNLELLGSGIGSLSPTAWQEFTTRVLPEIYQLAAAGQLSLPTATTSLADIATAWTQPIAPGTRLVVQL